MTNPRPARTSLGPDTPSSLRVRALTGGLRLSGIAILCAMVLNRPPGLVGEKNAILFPTIGAIAVALVVWLH